MLQIKVRATIIYSSMMHPCVSCILTIKKRFIHYMWHPYPPAANSPYIESIRWFQHVHSQNLNNPLQQSQIYKKIPLSSPPLFGSISSLISILFFTVSFVSLSSLELDCFSYTRNNSKRVMFISFNFVYFHVWKTKQFKHNTKRERKRLICFQIRNHQIHKFTNKGIIRELL